MFKAQSSLNQLMSGLSLVVGLSLLGGCASAPSESPSTPSTEATESTIENKPESLVSEENTTVSPSDSSESSTKAMSPRSPDYPAGMFKRMGYELIEVDGGDLSGYRKPNVVVDIGFGDREYWAFTNEYGQLVRVAAKEIILQDDSKEPVNSKGRYYSDEAKVPGVESKYLDEGHVIADSLGGVSNAYNITPQNSTLNRHGDQAYMEKAIREAGGCTYFLAIITYPNTTTQIPSHYRYSYTINGNDIRNEFDNVNPDEHSANLESDGNKSASGQSQTNSNSTFKDNNPNGVHNVESNAPKESYKNCKLLREVYPNGVPEGHPAYNSKHDRDKDGWACETTSK